VANIARHWLTPEIEMAALTPEVVISPHWNEIYKNSKSNTYVFEIAQLNGACTNII